MGYRKQIRDILEKTADNSWDNKVNKKGIDALAQAMYDAAGRNAQDKATDSFAAARAIRYSPKTWDAYVLELGAKLAAGATIGEVAHPDTFGFMGSFKRYTDYARGLTFQPGMVVYIKPMHASALVERVYNDRLVLSDNFGDCVEVAIGDCFPVQGLVEIPEHFLPLDSTVIRADGQLGLVCMDQAGERFVGYGPADFCEIDTVLNNWQQYQVKKGQWLYYGLDWYCVNRVDPHRVELRDDGPRYHGKRIPGDDTVPVSACRVNVVTRHYIGERVYAICHGQEGTIESYIGPTEPGGTGWCVKLDDGCVVFPYDFTIESVPYYVGQKVCFQNRICRVIAVANQVVDGSNRATHVRLVHGGVAEHNVSVSAITPLVCIEGKGSLKTLFIDPQNLKAIREALSLYSHYITDQGKRQLLSMARMHIAEEEKTNGSS